MDKGTLGDRSHIFPGFYNIARFRGRGKFPFLLGIQRVGIDAPLQEPSRLLCQKRQRILKAIVNLAQKARSQLRGKHVPGERYLITALNAICHLINLYLGNRSPDTDHFAFERGVSNFYIANLIH